ncbi:MAG TPA: phosphoribosylanthranilate isomerase [Candidatus Dormibacteraeota bacterium]|nr:phosphoribosylanthranilate isomerase [Candidatus Dormibacteraeota bacterium]
MTRIKICGNTRKEDVDLAVELGVDLLGFIFGPSKRHVEVGQATALLADVPENIERVGVFVDESPATIREAIDACGLTAVQVYRGISDEDRGLGVTLLPALRIRNGEDLDGLHFETMDHPLLDTWVSETAGGGTGQTWAWTRATQLARRYPIIVSGGLNPANVAIAVERLKPWGVDVCSGVEAQPGQKDHAKLRAFVTAVRRADER